MISMKIIIFTYLVFILYGIPPIFSYTNAKAQSPKWLYIPAQGREKNPMYSTCNANRRFLENELEKMESLL